MRISFIQKIIFFSIIVGIPSIIFAKIIIVPDEISTIQGAIDFSVNGDTIIVEHGTYYDNLNYNGKNITVASRFLLTGDQDDISQTVIDGGQNGSVVIFENHEDSTAVLCGFIITNGSGTRTIIPTDGISRRYGGGIFCNTANPTLKDLIIHANKSEDEGGGIYCYLSLPHLINIVVSQNSSWNGGGITLATHSDAIVENVRIEDNQAESWGGGLFINQANPIIKRTLIRNNRATYHGGGIAFLRALAQFDAAELSSIYSNSSAEGRDLYSYQSDVISVHLDTFSVKEPSAVHALPLDKFIFNVNTGFLEQVAGDIYVSPAGNDQNSGSQSNPFRTISHALYILYADSLDTAHVFIMDGVYSPDTNELFPLVIPDYVGIYGQGQTTTLLSGEESTHTISIFNAQNVRIENLAIKNGAGGINCENSKVELQKLLINENTASSGGGILVRGSDLRLENIKLFNNTASANGGAIFAVDSKIWLEGVSIHNNSANDKGGAIYFSGTTLNFDPVRRCSIYLNTAEGSGSEFYSHNPPLTYVYLDTFTTSNPTNKEVDPVALYIFDILYSITGVLGSELYISPQGNDINSGLSWDEPLKTLNTAFKKIIADSLQPGKIYLDEGLYSKEVTGESFPIKLKSYTTLKGAGLEKTVIKADQRTSVFYINNIQASTIEGVSVTNGRGTYLQWGLDYNYFGGGIYCKNSEILLKDMEVYNNQSPFRGGGIYCDNSNISLEDVSIRENTAYANGGGIYFFYSNPFLKNVTVKFNQVERIWSDTKSYGTGGGIVFENSTPVFDTQKRCNIYQNDAQRGRDLSATNKVHVVLDTFTVLVPTSFEVQHLENFTFDILHEKNFSGKTIYVSPEGSDANAGNSWETPLRSISRALILGHGDPSGNLNIYLDEGIYSVSKTGEKLPLQLPDYVSLFGADIDKTRIDGEGKNQVIMIKGSKNVILSELTLENGAAVRGAGMAIYAASPVLKKIIMQNNHASSNGGALFLSNSNPTIDHTIIKNNSSINDGAAIFCWEADPVIINSTVINNSCDDPLGYHGGGLSTHATFISKPTIINSIFWGNRPEEFYLPSYDERERFSDILTIAYSDIDGGEQAILKEYNSKVNWQEGNISSDPLFDNNVENEYFLSKGSPCIDTGTAYYAYDGKVLLDLNAYSFVGVSPDMGAFEFGEPKIKYNAKSVEIFPNFPNPFKTYTSIGFGLPERHLVSLTLYNTLGQKIKTIFENRIFEKGINVVEVDLTNYSSGTYFCVLIVGDTVKARKIVLLR